MKLRVYFGLFVSLLLVAWGGPAEAKTRIEWRRTLVRHKMGLPYVQSADGLVLPGTRRSVGRTLESALAGSGLSVASIREVSRVGVCLVRLQSSDRLPRSIESWHRLTERILATGEVTWVGPVFFSGPATQAVTGKLWLYLDEAKATKAFLSSKGLRLVRWLHAGESLALVEPARKTRDVVELAERLVGEGLDLVPELMVRLYPRLLPDDQYFARQWTMWNEGDNVFAAFTGQALPAVAGADIRAEGAWDIETGSSDVIVGVIDSGVDCGHPDLAPNCLDGLDAIRNLPDASPPDPSTDMGAGHGTSVASIAAGALNGSGVVGVCPGCSIVPVRLIETNTFLSDEMMLRAFTFAVDQGAAVINNSWGPQGGGYFVPMPNGVWQGLQYAQVQGRGGLGTVVVFAAGNDNQSTSLDGELQSGLPNVMAVAASDQFDTKSDYSNYGAEISVCAPSSDGFLGPEVYAAEIRGNGNVAGDYTSVFGGTSGAAPVVSGLAALVISADPTLTAAEVVDLLEQTADKVDPDGARYDGDGHSVKYGYGRVNALRALLAATGQDDQPWCSSPAAQEDCDQHRDDNCDGFVDEGCTSNPTLGQPCSEVSECGAAPFWECPSSGKSQGLCTFDCSQRPCPAGSACVDGICVRECVADSECQENFVCSNDELGWCLPSCSGDQDCGNGEFCDPDTHLCALATDGQVGSPCNENSDCRLSGGFCLSAMMGFDGGYCTMSCSSDQECGGTNQCVFLEQYGSFCYKGCSLDGDCRPGYVCEQSGPRAGTCYKHCTTDDQCTGGDPQWTGIACDSDSGRCIDTREPDAGVEVDASLDAGVDSGGLADAVGWDFVPIADCGINTDDNESSGCNCRSSGGDTSLPLWLLLALGLGLVLRRRR